MDKLPKIQTPWKQQWRRIRYQLMPVATMGLAVLITAWLWKRHLGTVNGIGEVAVSQASVVSNREGLLVNISRRIEPFTSVRRNELIAKLDQRPALESIMSFRKDTARVRAALPKPPIASPTTQPTDPAGRAIYRESQRLAALETATQILIDCIEQSDEEAVVSAKLKEVRRAMKGGKIKRSDEKQPLLPENIEQPLDACRTEIDALDARIAALEGEVEALRIYAPMDGTVTGVYRYPNQTVRAGESIATITSAEGQQIVSYIRQEQGFQPITGMEVEVHPRIAGRKPSYGYIKHIGPKVEPVPHQQLRDPKTPEFGIPVVIEVQQGTLNLRPGQVVGVRYKLSE